MQVYAARFTSFLAHTLKVHLSIFLNPNRK